jgi:selenocysteine lyase/cysteine desulfurase
MPPDRGLAAAGDLWDPEPGFLDTASYGLPPRPAVAAVQAMLEAWRTGRTSWEPWDRSADQSRERFARLVNVPAADVAIGATVSGLLGSVATVLTAGARVVVPENEFGPPMDLAAGARRFDTSPAWDAWAGTAPALEVIEQIGVPRIGEHNVRLANRLRAGLGLPPGDSAIVSAGIPDAEARLARAGIRASTRAGRTRLACHIYTSEQDVDAAVDALRDGDARA